MTQYRHIVQVHPVENGEANLSKVKLEHEYKSKRMAMKYVDYFNMYYEHEEIDWKAVYRGRVNCETGELE